MIVRRKAYAKREPSRDAHKIYIVCEGKGTEPDYFSFFEGLSSNLQLITIPPDEGTDPLKLMECAREVLLGERRKYTIDYMQGDTIWFVIDTDTWEKECKIAPLRDFCSSKNVEFPKLYNEAKAYNAWNVAQSNPCFEIWLYFHFYEDKPVDEDVQTFVSFKEYVSSTISGGFDFQRDPVRLEDAVSNTRNNFVYDTAGRPDLYSSEVYILGEEIHKFVKNDLAKLRNKLG